MGGISTKYVHADRFKYSNTQLLEKAPYIIQHTESDFKLIDTYLEEVKTRYDQVDVNYDYESSLLLLIPYYCASQEEIFNLFNHLLTNYEFDLNRPIMDGGNVLPYLVKYVTEPRTFQLFIDQGINVNSFIPSTSKTALDMAYEQGDKGLVDYFETQKIRRYDQLASYGTKGSDSSPSAVV